MTGKLFGEPFHWHAIKKITFNTEEKTAMIDFLSGQMLEVKAPSEEKWDQLLVGAVVNLANDQVVYE